MNTAIKTLALSAIFTGLGFAAPTALAQNENNKKMYGYMSLGVGSTPEYEGADYQQTIPMIAARANWDYRYLELQDLSVKANILNSEKWEFGIMATATLGRDSDVDSASVAKLAELDDAVSIGIFGARVYRDVGLASGEFKIYASVLEDASDVYGSWQAAVGIGYSMPIGDKWRVSTDLSTSIMSDDYAETYFSINQAGSTASGLSFYKANGGVKDVSISVSASYAITKRWAVNGFAKYSQLQGDASDSPIVKVAGSENQAVYGLGLGYSF